MSEATHGRFAAAINRNRAAGFTLIEMLMVLAVAALFLFMAVPQFGRVIAGTQLSSQADLLNGILIYSRAEAVRRDTQVAVCPLNAALNGCQSAAGGSTDWSYGVLVFLDADHSGSYSSTKELRRLQLKDPGAASSVKVSATPALLTFKEDGHTTLNANATISVLSCGNQLKDSVELSVFGRARVVAGQAPAAQDCL
jgi:prepilin-type N-terminal cleavage/methylation domain-containing protein